MQVLVYGLLFLSHSSGSLGNSGMENNFTYLVISTGEVHTAEIIKKKKELGVQPAAHLVEILSGMRKP